MCKVLGVSRAGFYAWERRAPCDRELNDVWLTDLIKQIHVKSRGTYGARRIHAELRLEHWIRVGKKRVERLMALAGLSGCLPRRRKRTTNRVEGVRTAPDLVERDFDPHAPDRTWSADITYISTLEGWLFLSHVEDLFSRRIVGWEMSEHMRKELVISALEMAVGHGKPEAGCIHHSDKGSHRAQPVLATVPVDVTVPLANDGLRMVRWWRSADGVAAVVTETRPEGRAGAAIAAISGGP